MIYQLTNQAVSDLEDIWFYTATHWSEREADRYYDAIMDEIEYIAHHPLSGKDYGFVREGYRCAIAMSHLIFYSMKDSNSLTVIRILHQRMDIEQQLSEKD